MSKRGQLGQAIHDARLRAGLTQVQAASRAEIRQSHWSSIETGAYGSPGWELLLRICAALELTPDDLLPATFRRPETQEPDEYALAEPEPP